MKDDESEDLYDLEIDDDDVFLTDEAAEMIKAAVEYVNAIDAVQRKWQSIRTVSLN